MSSQDDELPAHMIRDRKAAEYFDGIFAEQENMNAALERIEAALEKVDPAGLELP